MKWSGQHKRKLKGAFVTDAGLVLQQRRRWHHQPSGGKQCDWLPSILKKILKYHQTTSLVNCQTFPNSSISVFICRKWSNSSTWVYFDQQIQISCSDVTGRWRQLLLEVCQLPLDNSGLHVLEKMLINLNSDIALQNFPTLLLQIKVSGSFICFIFIFINQFNLLCKWKPSQDLFCIFVFCPNKRWKNSRRFLWNSNLCLFKCSHTY